MELALRCPPEAPANDSRAEPAEPKRRRSNRPTRPQLLLRDQLDKRLNARKYMDQLVEDIERDLGGSEQLSTIERSLVEAFVASTITIAR